MTLTSPGKEYQRSVSANSSQVVGMDAWRVNSGELFISLISDIRTFPKTPQAYQHRLPYHGFSGSWL